MQKLYRFVYAVLAVIMLLLAVDVARALISIPVGGGGGEGTVTTDYLGLLMSGNATNTVLGVDTYEQIAGTVNGSLSGGEVAQTGSSTEFCYSGSSPQDFSIQWSGSIERVAGGGGAQVMTMAIGIRTGPGVVDGDEVAGTEASIDARQGEAHSWAYPVAVQLSPGECAAPLVKNASGDDVLFASVSVIVSALQDRVSLGSVTLPSIHFQLSSFDVTADTAVDGVEFTQPAGAYEFSGLSLGDWVQTGTTAEVCYQGTVTRKGIGLYTGTMHQGTTGAATSVIQMGLGHHSGGSVVDGDEVGATVRKEEITKKDDFLGIEGHGLLTMETGDCFAPLLHMDNAGDVVLESFSVTFDTVDGGAVAIDGSPGDILMVTDLGTKSVPPQYLGVGNEFIGTRPEMLIDFDGLAYDPAEAGCVNHGSRHATMTFVGSGSPTFASPQAPELPCDDPESSAVRGCDGRPGAHNQNHYMVNATPGTGPGSSCAHTGADVDVFQNATKLYAAAWFQGDAALTKRIVTVGNGVVADVLTLTVVGTRVGFFADGFTTEGRSDSGTIVRDGEWHYVEAIACAGEHRASGGSPDSKCPNFDPDVDAYRVQIYFDGVALAMSVDPDWLGSPTGPSMTADYIRCGDAQASGMASIDDCELRTTIPDLQHRKERMCLSPHGAASMVDGPYCAGLVPGLSWHGPPLNILMVYVDDVGCADMGFCDPEALPDTGTLDAIAAQGLHLPNFQINSARCSPGRSQLWTGRLAFRNGVVAPGGSPFLLANRRCGLS